MFCVVVFFIEDKFIFSFYFGFYSLGILLEFF